jgi:hypothetical protein
MKASVLLRAEALLGASPVLTFQADASDPSSCCSVQLEKVAEGRWLGLVLDRAWFADRVRMGMRPRFVVHHDGATPVVCGEAEARVLGRVTDGGTPPAGLDARMAAVARLLAARQPFGGDDLVVVEVKPYAMQIDDGESAGHGAIPRT